MGLDKVRHTPCGFCFVVYYTRADTEDCVKYINGMALDERLIRVDFDWGFRDGRQFGRGKSGGQVRCAHIASFEDCVCSKGVRSCVVAIGHLTWVVCTSPQVRDEYRMDHDEGRGGFGHIKRCDPVLYQEKRLVAVTY